MPAAPPTAAPPTFSPLPPPQYAAAPNRMDTHVKVVGALQIVLALLSLFFAMAVLVSGDYGAQQIEDQANDPETAQVARAMMRIVSMFLLVIGVLGIVGAIGLFMLKGWGRGLSLAFCAIMLLAIPFGTAIGIYGLVILARRETGDLFRTAPAGASA